TVRQSLARPPSGSVPTACFHSFSRPCLPAGLVLTPIFNREAIQDCRGLQFACGVDSNRAASRSEQRQIGMMVRIGKQRDVSQVRSEEFVEPVEFHYAITIRTIQPSEKAIIRIP